MMFGVLMRRIIPHHPMIITGLIDSQWLELDKKKDKRRRFSSYFSFETEIFSETGYEKEQPEIPKNGAFGEVTFDKRIVKKQWLKGIAC